MYHKYLKQLLSLVLFFFMVSPLCIASDSITSKESELNIANAIDIAGQQRMLAHQALVAYAQIGQVQSFGNPVELKMRAIEQFEQNLSSLSQHENLLISTNNVQLLWNKYKAIILEVPDKKQIPVLVQLNDELLAETNNIIAKLLKGKAQEMDIINIAGQQRMLSQRIALFMLIKNWGVEEDYQQKFVSSLSRFSKNHIILQENKANTSDINKKLKSVKRDYQKLITIISKKDDVLNYSFSIARLTSQILRKVKNNTKLYIKLMNANEASFESAEKKRLKPSNSSGFQIS